MIRGRASTASVPQIRLAALCLGWGALACGPGHLASAQTSRSEHDTRAHVEFPQPALECRDNRSLTHASLCALIGDALGEVPLVLSDESHRNLVPIRRRAEVAGTIEGLLSIKEVILLYDAYFDPGRPDIAPGTQLSCDVLLSEYGPRLRLLRRSCARTQLSGVRRSLGASDPRHLLPGDNEPTLRGFNYYPGEASWERFWLQYPRPTVERDFSAMARVGANTVRVFISYDATNGSAPDAAARSNLRHLLDTALSNDLFVVVTLFDFFLPYSPVQWAAADSHLRHWLQEFSDHPAILAWDIKNEPDRDKRQFGTSTVRRFLRFAAERARAYDPNHLLTIGFLSPDEACVMSQDVDFISFHYYGSPFGLSQSTKKLLDHCGDLPIVLGEFGSSSAELGQDAQATYFETIRGALSAQELSGYLVWTWSDFDVAPLEVTGGDQKIHAAELSFGLLDVERRRKPALQVVKRWFTGLEGE